MNEFLAEQVASEREYNENRALMQRSERERSVSRLFCLYGNIAVFLLSIASMFLWSVNTRVEIMVEIGATELTEKPLPLFCLLMFYTPFMIGLAVASDIQRRALFTRISGYVSLALLILTIVNLFAQFQYTSQDVPVIVYLVSEVIFSYIALNAYGRMEMLSTREGYPDFDYAVMAEKTSVQDRYIRMREEWLNKDKKLSYHSKNEQPISDPGVIEPEKPDETEGVYVTSDEQKEWFFISQNNEAVEEKEEFEPDSVTADPSYLPPDDFYKTEDIRKKPLL